MKAVFFDIDGTLWDQNNVIPPSTVEAIHLLQKNGHLAFLNTGRTRGFVTAEHLLDIGFDGIVSGCGTMIEEHGKVLYYHRINPQQAVEAVETVRAHGFKPILEGKDYLYMDMEDFGGDPYGSKLVTELGENLLSIKDHYGQWEMSKLSCDTKGCDIEAVRRELGDRYTFLVHNSEVVELVPVGHDKGSGIRKVCEILDIPLENTVSFGDSVNDLDMLRQAGIGVAMGNGTEDAKAAADYVTTHMKEDGIYKALDKFGLI
ncbi:MAG: Cof-type HAD-IIB family hydrolase [Lachnospiraceae bacterium]|jgi:Cof subfamily protein (haloacid dehalogenase superfamily)|nr:Cof-type HAD-IIB family hydrolase [Lachnospiraceae bacterium]